MGALSFRRVVAILATIALLLSGAAPAVAGELCAQTAAAASMASHHGTPCDPDGKAPDRPMGTACASACFARCPAPMPSLDAPQLAWLASPTLPSAAPGVRLVGVGVAPPLQPPKS